MFDFYSSFVFDKIESISMKPANHTTISNSDDIICKRFQVAKTEEFNIHLYEFTIMNAFREVLLFAWQPT